MWMHHGSASKYVLQLETLDFKQSPNGGGRFYKVVQCSVNTYSCIVQQHLTKTWN